MPPCLCGHIPTSKHLPTGNLNNQRGSTASEKRLGLLFSTLGSEFQILLLTLPRLPPNYQGDSWEGKQMYLKEGDIGKAESEEVVPVKTKMEIISQAGSAGIFPGSSFLASASWGARTECRLQRAYSGPTPRESFTSISSFNLHSNSRGREGELHFADKETV